MRTFSAALLIVPALFAVEPTTPPDRRTVTLFYEAPDRFSPVALESMQRELARLLEPSALRFEWLELAQAPETGVVSDLVLLRFRGTCSMGSLPPLADELGPFASTSVSDGVVLPFSAIDCEKLRRAVYLALWGGQRAKADFYLGRALGRVVAHELYHVFSRSMRHGRAGVARHALTAAGLISDDASFHPEDLHSFLNR